MRKRKRAKRSRLNIYLLGLAVIAAGIVGYYLPTQRPESGTVLTPKQYIELVEKKKAERLKASPEETAEAQDEAKAEESSDKAAESAAMPESGQGKE